MRSGATYVICLLITLAGAQGAHAAGQAVNMFGCVSRGVMLGCLVIKDHRTGKTYQINAANPPPDPARNLLVNLTGQIAEGVDICMQGPVLKDIKWNYTKMSCRLPK